mgnify:CR=1 FL=1
MKSSYFLVRLLGLGVQQGQSALAEQVQRDDGGGQGDNCGHPAGAKGTQWNIRPSQPSPGISAALTMTA